MPAGGYLHVGEVMEQEGHPGLRSSNEKGIKPGLEKGVSVNSGQMESMELP